MILLFLPYSLALKVLLMCDLCSTASFAKLAIERAASRLQMRHNPSGHRLELLGICLLKCFFPIDQ